MESMKFFRSALVATGVLLVAACASQPASQPAPAAAPAPAAKAAPAASAAPAAAAAASPEAKPEADAAAALEKKFQEAARSYRAVQKDGKTMYCKREKVIGSTIPTMQCYTETQLRNQIEATEELKKRMRRGGGPCVQTGGCQGG